MLRGEFNKSLQLLNKAITVSPGNYKAYYNRALLFAQNRQYNNALADFNRAIELKNYMKAYSGRAAVYYELKDFPKAIKDAEYVLGKDPANFKAYYILGNCYNDMNILDKSLSNYDQAIELNPDEPSFYLKRAVVRGKQGNFENCLKDLNICLEINPRFAEAYYWKGVAKFNLKQDPCVDLKKALELGFSEAEGPLSNYCR
jgi:tetratricopeptide (TPR) repeat protein